MSDMINKPPHYNQSGIECIDAISASTGPNFKYYLQGNILKYLWRFDYKGTPIEDLRKARWYLDKLIEITESNITEKAIKNLKDGFESKSAPDIDKILDKLSITDYATQEEIEEKEIEMKKKYMRREL